MVEEKKHGWIRRILWNCHLSWTTLAKLSWIVAEPKIVQIRVIFFGIFLHAEHFITLEIKFTHENCCLQKTINRFKCVFKMPCLFPIIYCQLHFSRKYVKRKKKKRKYQIFMVGRVLGVNWPRTFGKLWQQCSIVFSILSLTDPFSDIA